MVVRRALVLHTVSVVSMHVSSFVMLPGRTYKFPKDFSFVKILFFLILSEQFSPSPNPYARARGDKSIMQTKHIGLLLSLATSLLAADIFSTSVPESCSTICQPVSDLTSQCDKGSSSPREGCICLNDSFDVAVIGGLCDSCLMQNKVEIKGKKEP